MADRYLLESGAPDGYLMEDGSGVYLLDAASVTWDPANKSSAVVLSNGNLTANGSPSTAEAVALATVGKTTGKWYFEVQVAMTSGGSMAFAVGMADGLPATNPIPGSAINSAIAYHQNGVVYRNSGNDGGANQAAYDSVTSYVIGVAFDADADKVWFALNNTYSGDPATGTGGHAPTGLTTYYPMYYGRSQTDVATLRPSAASQTYGSPSGFTALDSGSPPAAVPRSFAMIIG